MKPRCTQETIPQRVEACFPAVTSLKLSLVWLDDFGDIGGVAFGLWLEVDFGVWLGVCRAEALADTERCRLMLGLAQGETPGDEHVEPRLVFLLHWIELDELFYKQLRVGGDWVQ